MIPTPTPQMTLRTDKGVSSEGELTRGGHGRPRDVPAGDHRSEVVHRASRADSSGEEDEASDEETHFATESRDERSGTEGTEEGPDLQEG